MGERKWRKEMGKKSIIKDQLWQFYNFVPEPVRAQQLLKGVGPRDYRAPGSPSRGQKVELMQEPQITELAGTLGSLYYMLSEG